ncbi:TPA: hypothetical protein SLO42_003031 [Proteus mirabilis]|nr:hypothetical protein [Proteus mirabilis]
MNYGGMKEIAEKSKNSILLNNITTSEIKKMITTINKQYKNEAGFYSHSQYNKYSLEYYYKEINHTLEKI